MYTSKLKIKTASVNAWRSLCRWPDLSDCLVTSSKSQGRPQKKPADDNCWDDGEARREDIGWQSEDLVWRRHWRQTGRGRRGTGVLGWYHGLHFRCRQCGSNFNHCHVFGPKGTKFGEITGVSGFNAIIGNELLNLGFRNLASRN